MQVVSFREGLKLLLLPAPVMLCNCKECGVLWFRPGNLDLSLPSCVGERVVFSFDVYPNLSKAYSWADMCICLLGCQLNAGFNLELGLHSKCSVDLSYMFATPNGRAHGWSLAERRAWCCLRMEILLIKRELHFLISL